MRAFVDDAVLRGQAVHRLAAKLAASAGQFDRPAQVRALYDWLVRSIVFKKDTFPTEHLRHPEQLIAEVAQDGRTAADCDDLAMLAAAVLRSLGFRAVFIVAARTDLGPWEHVLPGYIDGGTLVPVDAQQRAPIGALPPVVRRIRVFPV